MRIPSDSKLDEEGLKREAVCEGAADHMGFLPVQSGEEFDDFARGVADV